MPTYLTYLYMQRFVHASSSRKARWRHSTRGECVACRRLAIQLQLGTTYLVYASTRAFPLLEKERKKKKIKQNKKMPEIPNIQQGGGAE